MPGAGAGAVSWLCTGGCARGGDRLLVLVVVLGAGRRRWCWCCELAVHVVLVPGAGAGAGCRCWCWVPGAGAGAVAVHVVETGCWCWCRVPVLALGAGCRCWCWCWVPVLVVWFAYMWPSFFVQIGKLWGSHFKYQLAVRVVETGCRVLVLGAIPVLGAGTGRRELAPVLGAGALLTVK